MFYCLLAVGAIFLNAWKQEGIDSIMQEHKIELHLFAKSSLAAVAGWSIQLGRVLRPDPGPVKEEQGLID